MRSRDALYRALRAQRGSWYETQILRGPAVYGDNVAEPYAKGIHSLELELALFDDDGPQIGIARAAKCRMEIEETKDNWPRGAAFTIRTRLHDEACTQASGWMSLGVFFTDQRKPDPFGTLTITAYDGMLLLEQSWTDKAELPSQWPITAAAAAALLEEATGVELENPELLDDTTPFIGLNTTSTAREVWSDIAAALGCNLQMTSEGRLRLIPFAALPDGYRGAVADLAIADVAIVDTTGGEPSGEYAPLGLDVTTVGTGSSLPAITGVELRTETGAVARAGDTSGYVLKGVCNFSDSAAAALCLSRVQGLAYRPFDCTDAYIDPAFEPGELVELNGVIYQIMVMEWTLCAKPTADLSAPYEEELEHEYAVQTSAGRALRIAISESRRESAEQLQTFITGSYAADLSAIRGQIDGKAETWYQAEDPAADWTDAQKTEHTGDLWYRTGDGVTLRYSGSAWVQMDVPDAVFDKIDGKAQIFTAQPVPPYNVGDLWFGGTGADIMTCVRARASGSYTASDWQKYNKYTDDTAANAAAQALQTFITGSYASDLSAIRGQIDGKAETWYQAGDPAADWTDAQKTEHTGDLWYRTGDGVTLRYSGSAWVQMDVPDAVFDKIDGKAQIFTAQPVPPYNVGDLWFGGAGADIMTCTRARASGSYTASDWQKYNKYTDDTAANAAAQALQTFITGSYATDLSAIRGQIDGKAETWYQAEDPAADWTDAQKTEHTGDLWYRTGDGVTLRYSGSAWVQMDVPDAVFDKIDGKAQIFTAQPAPPYNVGDLWFGGAGADIMTCVRARSTGSYTASDWQKYNKYTDDTAANAAAQALQTFITGSYASDLSAIRGQIDGKAETWYQAEDPAADWTDAQKTEHTGDLWYRTGDGVTLRYSGSAWVQMDVPDAVFDRIDGKAQIFTAQPVPPYNVGDLWFGGAGADIKTCTRARATGSYTASDWQKYNKYTDDTAANAVAEDLDENYMTATDTQSAIEQTALSIRQNVASTYVSNVKLAEQLSGYSPTNAIDAKFSTKAEAKASADALKSEIKLTDDTLTLAFSQLRADTDDAVNAMSYYIRYKDGVVIIGKTDSPTSIRISNQQIALYYGEDVISYWNQERQYTPKALQIPQGGSFTLGSTLFQPRSSGNLSFMWVGD